MLLFIILLLGPPLVASVLLSLFIPDSIIATVLSLLIGMGWGYYLAISDWRP